MIYFVGNWNLTVTFYVEISGLKISCGIHFSVIVVVRIKAEGGFSGWWRECGSQSLHDQVENMKDLMSGV